MLTELLINLLSQAALIYRSAL